MAEASAPEEFICPITKEIMADPVFTADGQTYERAAIEQWFARGRTSSPITGLALCSKTLTPNFALKNAIETYQKDRPELEERAHQVKDLQACLATCERELQQANARAAASAEYVLHLQEKQPSSATLSNGSSSDSVAQPQSAHKYDDVVAAHKLSLQQRATMAERVSAQASSEQLELGKEIQACVGSIADSEAKAAREELQTTVQRKQVDALSELVLKKEAERDAIGAQVLAHTEPLGMDGPAMLASIRANPAAAWDGPLRAAYAELHCECIALAMEKHSAHEASLPVEKAGVESRVNVRGTKRKLQDLQSQLQEVDRRAEVANQKAKRARQAVTDFSDDGMKARAPWLQRLPWQASAENLRSLAVLHEKCQSSMRSMRSAMASQLKHDGQKASDLKGVGFTASELKGAGCAAAELSEVFSAGELKDGGFTASELKDAHFTLDRLKEGGFTVAHLKDAGFAADQLDKGGFTVGDLKEGGFAAAELKKGGVALDRLKEGGFTPAQLKDAHFGADQLANVGFTVRELMEDGLTLGNLYEDGFSVSELRESGVTAGLLKEELFTLELLKDGGFSVGDLKEAGFTAREMEVGGCTLDELKEAGFTVEELKDRSAPRQPKDCGSTVAELKEQGLRAAELKERGFTLDQLKEGGFSAGQLKESGFAADQLKASGFTAHQLKIGGFQAADLKGCGYEARDLFALCSTLPELDEGLPIVTLDGFGCLTARDKDDNHPWYAEPVWPRGHGRAKSNASVRDLARALQW